MPTDEPTAEVTTAQGRVRGLRRPDGSAAFLGIPFAEPPVGDLRFAAPVPHRGWDGVRDATAHGATPQRTQLAEVTLIPEPSIPGESTLNVDVFTPSPEPVTDGGLPVLVWIHGGGFVAGSPASPWYDGAGFNRDGVVTVTVSYRLGFDGFGWISDAPANRGVLDWLLALEWVRDNIRAFGGDPSRVTIAGQSAGGGAVLTLLGMPRAQGLFARVHCISGAVADVPIGRAEALGRELAELLGVAPTRAGLATLDEERVLAAQRTLVPIGESAADPAKGLEGLLDGLALGPVVDGDLLPEPTLDALRRGVGADTPLVLGATDHEFTFAFARAREQLADVAPTAVLAGTGLDPSVIEAYVAAHEDLDTADVVGQLLTDTLFSTTVAEVATARGDAPTWLYRFAWRSPVLGYAVHCLDLPFYFGCPSAPGVAEVAGTDLPPGLVDDVHGAAVAFVGGGDPGWPAWAPAGGKVRVFDRSSSLEPDGFQEVWSLLRGAARRA